jgi:hypothetical protein
MIREKNNLLMKTLLGSFFEEEKKQIALEANVRLMNTIRYYLGDPLTVLLGKAQLSLDSLNNGGMDKEETQKLVLFMREELQKICLVLNVLADVSQLKYKTHPLGMELFDLEKEMEGSHSREKG